MDRSEAKPRLNSELSITTHRLCADSNPNAQGIAVMSPTRRGFLHGAAQGAAAASLMGHELTAAELDDSFRNNVPDASLSGKELPTFKFALEKSTGKEVDGSFGKEATVEQLPISKGIAGVSMRLEPGVARELHWHATAAEWAFVIEGRCRTTATDPEGRTEINDFQPGDVWYFPRGHGHSIQCLGDKACHFILIFDNGHFSEFGTFSVTDWLGHAPRELVAKNLGISPRDVDNFPKEEVYFAKGPIPPDAMPSPHAGAVRSSPLTHKYRLLTQPPLAEFAGGKEWRVGAAEFPISKTMTGVILDLEPAGLRELHWHPTADEWQYLIEGKVQVTLFGSHGRFRTETLEAGDVGYIPQGYGHSIENVGITRARMLIGFNTGHYQSIGLSQWMSGIPDYLLAAHFKQPKETIARFPKSHQFIIPSFPPKQY